MSAHPTRSTPPGTADRRRSGRGGRRRAPLLPLAAAVLLASAQSAAAPPAAAQDLGRLAEEAETEAITFAFPARPGVCGAGDGILIREPDGATRFISGRLSTGDWRRWRAGAPPCEVGNVVVRLRHTATGFNDLELRVGTFDSAAGAGHLGLFGGQAAADFLLAEAVRAPERDARRMILAAALADDAVTWRALLRLAKDRSLPRGTRRSAMQWLGREAAVEAVRELGGIVRDRSEDDEIREAAVFGLSQIPGDGGVTLLIDVARRIDDPRIRRSALFWLAQSDDPRALALFEEILTDG